MVKSMYAAVAGLKSHQSKMDVISNNIANVNTWGYKSMTASFKESMYQTLSSGSAGSTNDGAFGATNPTMLGYGSMVSAISANFTKGSPAPTDRSLDLFIDGNAFFMVGPIYGDGEARSPEDVYMSRVGDFEVRNGYLVDSNGRYVYGNVMAEGGNTREIIKYETEPTTLTQLDFTAEKNLKTTTVNGVAGTSIVNSNGTPVTNPLLLSVTNPGYYVVNGTKRQVIHAEAGENGNFNITYATEDIPTVNGDYEYKTGHKGKVISIDDSVNPPVIHYSTVPKVGDMYTAPDGTKGIVTEVTLGGAGSDDHSNVTIKYDKRTSSSSTFEGPDIENMEFDPATGSYKMGDVDSLKPIKIPTTCKYWDEETQSYITENNVVLQSYTISGEGMIYGTSASGKTYLLGSVALINVTNPNGMTKSDGPYYQLSASSGSGNIIAAGGDESLKSGYLEMANVDIATEFSSMITTQRGFQANSKIISVTDEMLQELVNMKR